MDFEQYSPPREHQIQQPTIEQQEQEVGDDFFDKVGKQSEEYKYTLYDPNQEALNDPQNIKPTTIRYELFDPNNPYTAERKLSTPNAKNDPQNDPYDKPRQTEVSPIINAHHNEQADLEYAMMINNQLNGIKQQSTRESQSVQDKGRVDPSSKGGCCYIF